MTKPSKYGSILDAHKNPSAEVEPDLVEPSAAPDPPAPIAPSPAASSAPAESATPPALPRRPKGKRSDSSYSQRTAYLPLRLHHDVDVALKDDNLAAAEQGRPAKDFSELVAELLSAWLANRTPK